ncbi:hypothetical protein LEM8419_01589 [Neolewinella maritima]|uniref:PIG-L family deacetylase n=1 Tax=Neolewinella maritima TaxID=1383882 RepID=A0ABN8F160_9BACT|nr:PIG-L family deacetylase [Neolewinella maritima]CAH1000436.1 hypothetical protein LEM8419_01589 [Neolewinella maritima]
MILVLSPHLDDAVFSCGGLLATLASERVLVVTCFTRSMADPQGFALACQLDKGLSAEVDYMALRRAEDVQALELLGVHHHHLDLPEAPHRGYHSATELFGAIHADDTVGEELQQQLALVVHEYRPLTILYPLGAGNHVDHQQVVRVAENIRSQHEQVDFIQYYDQPYTHRHPLQHPDLQQAAAWRPTQSLPPRAAVRFALDAPLLERKYAACRAYTTQVGYQFKDERGMQTLLGDREYFRVYRPYRPTTLLRGGGAG